MQIILKGFTASWEIFFLLVKHPVFWEWVGCLIGLFSLLFTFVFIWNIIKLICYWIKFKDFGKAFIHVVISE